MAGKVEERNFNYIGFRIIQDKNSIISDQSRYVENIENKAMIQNVLWTKHDLLALEEQTAYSSL